jgi:hypothetical protein
MTLTDVQATTTKTAAFTGTGIDVASFTGDWTLKIQVQALSDNKKVRFAFEDTVNDFTASVAGPTFSFAGKLEASYDRVKSFKKQDFPDLRLGTASAKLRLNMSRIDSSASVTYKAWIES